jgi:hypothetical protein
MDNERLLEILMYNVTMLTDKINFYQEQGISQKKIDLLLTKKAKYQQAIIDLE